MGIALRAVEIRRLTEVAEGAFYDIVCRIVLSVRAINAVQEQ
jgi:hypothetical protein